jgi:hypothetical protein
MTINVLGVDLGQARDYTALAGIEATGTAYQVPYSYQDRDYGRMAQATMDVEGLPVTFKVRYLERLALGTEYPDVVDAVCDRLARVPGGALLVVDATGVGRPVVDMLAQRGLNLAAVTITGGERTHGENGHWRVPKQDLIGILQIALQNRAMKFPKKLAATEDLVKEVLDMEAKATAAGNLTAGAWRYGQHDDLVLALALACWLAEAEFGARAQIGLAEAEAASSDAAYLADEAAHRISPC